MKLSPLLASVAPLALSGCTQITLTTPDGASASLISLMTNRGPTTVNCDFTGRVCSWSSDTSQTPDLGALVASLIKAGVLVPK